MVSKEYKQIIFSFLTYHGLDNRTDLYIAKIWIVIRRSREWPLTAAGKGLLKRSMYSSSFFAIVSLSWPRNRIDTAPWEQLQVIFQAYSSLFLFLYLSRTPPSLPSRYTELTNTRKTTTKDSRITNCKTARTPWTLHYFIKSLRYSTYRNLNFRNQIKALSKYFTFSILYPSLPFPVYLYCISRQPNLFLCISWSLASRFFNRYFSRTFLE